MGESFHRFDDKPSSPWQSDCIGFPEKACDVIPTMIYHGNILQLAMVIVLEIKELVPMAPDVFKSEINRRGWHFKSLAIRWGMSERRVRQIIADADRPRYYDDAVIALPVIVG